MPMCEFICVFLALVCITAETHEIRQKEVAAECQQRDAYRPLRKVSYKVILAYLLWGMYRLTKTLENLKLLRKLSSCGHPMLTQPSILPESVNDYQLIISNNKLYLFQSRQTLNQHLSRRTAMLSLSLLFYCIIIIIINEFHRDASLKQNFRAAAALCKTAIKTIIRVGGRGLC